jgi:hypothetical protein
VSNSACSLSVSSLSIICLFIVKEDEGIIIEVIYEAGTKSFHSPFSQSAHTCTTKDDVLDVEDMSPGASTGKVNAWVGKNVCCDECGVRYSLSQNDTVSYYPNFKVGIHRCRHCDSAIAVRLKNPYKPIFESRECALGSDPGVRARLKADRADHARRVAEARLVAHEHENAANLKLTGGWTDLVEWARNEQIQPRGEAALAYLRKRLPMLFVLTDWKAQRDSRMKPRLTISEPILRNKGLGRRLRRMAPAELKTYLRLGLEARASPSQLSAIWRRFWEEAKRGGPEGRRVNAAMHKICDVVLYLAIAEGHTSQGRWARKELGAIIPKLFGLCGQYPVRVKGRRCLLGGECEEGFRDQIARGRARRWRSEQTESLSRGFERLQREYDDVCELLRKMKRLRLSKWELLDAGVLSDFQLKLVDIFVRRDPEEILNGLLWPRLCPQYLRNKTALSLSKWWKPYRKAWILTLAPSLGLQGDASGVVWNYRERHGAGLRRKLPTKVAIQMESEFRMRQKRSRDERKFLRDQEFMRDFQFFRASKKRNDEAVSGKHSGNSKPTIVEKPGITSNAVRRRDKVGLTLYPSYEVTSSV